MLNLLGLAELHKAGQISFCSSVSVCVCMRAQGKDAAHSSSGKIRQH